MVEIMNVVQPVDGEPAGKLGQAGNGVPTKEDLYVNYKSLQKHLEFLDIQVDAVYIILISVCMHADREASISMFAHGANLCCVRYDITPC
jgi:hypothetical protein